MIAKDVVDEKRNDERSIRLGKPPDYGRKELEKHIPQWMEGLCPRSCLKALHSFLEVLVQPRRIVSLRAHLALVADMIRYRHSPQPPLDCR